MKKTIFFSAIGLATSYLFYYMNPKDHVIVMTGMIYALGLEILYNQTKK